MPQDKEEIEQQLKEFLLNCTNALMLATVNAEILPEASYVPYIEHEGHFYIFISQLASHTANLKRSEVSSVLFVENNVEGHPFTRKRLTCHCEVAAVEREAGLFESIMLLMEERFGKLVATLRGLADFQLFQLKPVRGNFVAGFGQAFEINFPLGGDIRHTRPG